MRSFCVGDRLRVRQWDDMEEEFGLDSDGNIPCMFVFMKVMRKYCGMVFTVKHIVGKEYFPEEEDLFGYRYSFSADMLEYDKSAFDIAETDIDNLLGF